MIDEIISLAKEAGRAIIEVYSKDFSVEIKKDDHNSPLTEADKAAHKVIVRGLEKYGFPVLSEEGVEIPYSERKNWKKFWLVDPLDGTKEFVSRNGNFTVNIALIEDGKPILGVIYVPTKDVLYYSDGNGAFKNGEKLDGKHNGKLAVVASKNHMNKETEEFISELGDCDIVNIGSSLKFCLVASGEADIYPRLGPTMEWDTGAAHAIVNAVGKKVYKYKEDGNYDEELSYNKEDLHNPWFVVK